MRKRPAGGKRVRLLAVQLVSDKGKKQAQEGERVNTT